MNWLNEWQMVQDHIGNMQTQAHNHRRAKETKPQKVSAYILVSCVQPHHLLSKLRRLPGVIKANALINSSEAILVVEEPNMEALNGLLECLERLPGVKLVQPKIAV